jgi:type IV secretory pathway VirB10-like protein
MTPDAEEAASEVAPQPPKLDPETLVLRGRPPRVIRFRRGVIIGLAGAGASLVLGVLWFGLEPAQPARNDPVDLPVRPRHERVADVLASAPKDYAEIPVLGPPLPGDLGRPILAHRRSAGLEAESPLAGASDAAAAEEARRAAELQAARVSGVMVRLARPGSSGLGIAAGGGVPSDLAPAEPERAGSPGIDDHAGARAKTNGRALPQALVPSGSPYTLSAGSVIAASLLTGLNSDLPGLVTAQVTEGVYDTATGRVLLIPQGARLVGRYDDAVAFGQSRARVVWQRLIMPGGAAVALGNMPAADTAGYAGLSDSIDRHGGTLLKGVLLSSLLGVGAELSIEGESDLVEALRESAQQGTARAGDQVVTKALGIQPTLTVRPGWPLRVLVHEDLVLRPWEKGEEP